MPVSQSLSSLDLTEALAALRADREAMPWPRRRQIVSLISGPLSEGMGGEPFRSLLLLLADDPKWEVRKDVADALGGIVDTELGAVADKLLSDTHAYVRRAAKRVIEQRRLRRSRKRGIELVLSLYQELEDQHGKIIAGKARRLAEQLYDTLIAATVHEMRSVLTALQQDNLQIIEREQAGALEPAFLRRKSLKIADRLSFMERLLRDMRNYAQPVPGERVEVAVADLVIEARSIVSENLKARDTDVRRVELHISVPEGMHVKVSRVHIVTALVNVLGNAYDFLTNDGQGPIGKIDLLATGGSGFVRIAVRDTGIGIPAANLEEVRQCLPGRTSRRNVGTGFGLCNTRRYVEAHGGRLWIESVENEGTTATLSLPAA